jgi:ribosomal protein L24E
MFTARSVFTFNRDALKVSRVRGCRSNIPPGIGFVIIMSDSRSGRFVSNGTYNDLMDM